MLLTFERHQRLRAHFQLIEGRLRFADGKECATNIVLHTDNDDVMTFSFTTTDETQLQDGTASVSDALFLLCGRVAENMDAAELVFIGSEHPLLNHAAAGTGFRTNWMDPTDAAIREWQWASSPETAGSATDVIVLRFGEKVLKWDFRVASPHGDFVIPDTETQRPYGSFRLTGTATNLNVGIKCFLDWMERMTGSRHIVIAGRRGETLAADLGLVSAFEMRGQEVFVSNLVLGGARPAFPSRFVGFDTAVNCSLKALDAAYDTEGFEETLEAFNTAIEAFNQAEALFAVPEDAPDELDQLRHLLRSYLLLKADATKRVEDGGVFLHLALKLSKGDAEIAEVKAYLATYYVKISEYVKAEDAALAAHFLDDVMYSDIMAETANQKRRRQ